MLYETATKLAINMSQGEKNVKFDWDLSMGHVAYRVNA